MAFVALAMPWLASQQAQDKRKGWIWLIAILVLGQIKFSASALRLVQALILSM
jgi:hypothetical protein